GRGRGTSNRTELLSRGLHHRVSCEAFHSVPLAPPVIEEGPDEPEQSQWPELNGKPECDPQHVVGRAFDHSAASASSCECAGASAATRRAVPPCVLATTSASSKRARPSQWRRTLLNRKPARRTVAVTSLVRGAGNV